MESSDEEKDSAFETCAPAAIRRDLSSSGGKFVDEVLNGPNERCRENFCMDKPVFYKLCDILRSKGLLHHTNKIKIEEQLSIFMFIVGHNLRTRAVQELFGYSGETISRHFNNVLNAILAVSLDFFESPSTEIPPEIRNEPRFYPYFKDCVGVVDGMQIPVMVGVDDQGLFRNKNGSLSQTVLVACSFDLKFHYVLAGWEGSATDFQVLYSAMTRRNKMPVPEGKYYILDNKYVNLPGYVAPYPGVPYHSNDFPVGYQPQNAKEIFNQRHFLLKDASDRTVGALKARFPILMTAPPYPLATQVKLVIAACTIHNYIRMEAPDDPIFKMYDHDRPLPLEESLTMTMHDENSALEVPFEDGEVESSSRLRDSIAAEIWDDYISDMSPL